MSWDSLVSPHINSLSFWHKYCMNSDKFLSEGNSLTKMDESEDNRKRRTNHILNDWSNNPFERVNHSTNFEDYACTSDETNFLYPNSTHKKDHFSTSTQPITINRDSISKSSKLDPLVWNHLSDQREHNSSAEVTPSGTPQSSPYSMRKVMENKRLIKTNEKPKNELSVNQKRWFYTGFFSDMKTGLEDKPIPQIPKTQSFKNLCVSNFDINAVGPTSW